MSTITNDTDQRSSVPSPGQPPRPPRDDRGGADGATRRRAIWALGGVLIVLLLLAGVVFGVTLQLASQVTRIPNAFAGLTDAARPAPGAGQTFLLVSTDSQAAAGAPRSDTIMLGTVAPDGSHASLVSIPRDALVDAPGRGKGTVGDAYATGGPSSLVGTVEGLTRVRIDHVAVLDIAGFGRIGDAVDGINVSVAAPTSSDGVSFVAGPQHLDGSQVQAYVRQRAGLPGGEVDHVRREQNAMRALINSAVSAGATSNPFRAYGLTDALTASTSVDDTMSNGDLWSLAWTLRDLRTRNIDFVTAPVAVGPAPVGTPPGAVLLDDRQGRDLWSAVNAGTVGGYVTSHPGSALPGSLR